MFDKFSPDEGCALIVSAVIGLILWARWYFLLGVTGRKVRARGARWPLGFALLVCLAMVWIVLARWSSEDVRTDAAYICFYLVVATGWLGLFRLLLPLFGLNPIDEVLERGNNVAGWVIVGALIAGTCCFAGGNVGNGPGWWVVLFSASLSTGSLFLLWWLVHCFTALPEKIIVERDPAAGFRATGFLIGAGLILGRAVAGDWISAEATVVDFGRMAWPALVLATAAIGVERSSPLKLAGQSVGCLGTGWLPAVVYVAAGVVVVVMT